MGVVVVVVGVVCRSPPPLACIVLIKVMKLMILVMWVGNGDAQVPSPEV